MSTKRINILIYSGPGATISSVRHATWSLRRLLGPNYAIITITTEQLLNEPWTASCALLVMPGGADLGYCRMLNGEGNRKIKRYVQMGGSYLGLCAGGYYGSSRCEFEVGKRGMEVVGDRELAFYPDTCRGLAFPGFVYASEAGARAVELQVNGEALGEAGEDVPHTFRSYYNGGGVFVNGDDHKEKGVEVLASFAGKLAVESGGGKAAVVYCKVGEGNVILTGPHPEFAGENLDRDQPNAPGYAATVDAIVADDKARTGFLKACLVKLGLEVSQNTEPVPSLSRLHLSAAQSSTVSELVHSWQEAGIVKKDADGIEWMRCENETFVLEQVGRWNMAGLQAAVADALPAAAKNALPEAVAPVSASTAARKENNPPSTQGAQANSGASSVDRALDYNSLTKHLVAHESAWPDGKETPYFNHHAYFANLNVYQKQVSRESRAEWGKSLLYGEVVTSTNTLLEKNPSLLCHLPAGFTATATTQVAGRGRGNNVWVSPHGSLMFSTVLRHPLALSNTAPVVFVQYLAAMAVVNAIHGYDKGHDKLPIKLKWPNDIYALDPNAADAEKQQKAYTKIAGILVNSSYASGDYTLVTGIGLNVHNSRPSTSLTHLTNAHGLQPFTLEKLLAGIVVHFEELYSRFTRTGFDAQFEEAYYRMWLHTDQVVTLETEGGVKCRVKGITRDWGLLIAEELTREGRPTGKRFEMQSDSNSFDFFKGLVRKKS